MNSTLNINKIAIASSYWENVGDNIKDVKGSAAALKAYEKALELLPKQPNPEQLSYLEYNIGLGYAEQKDFPIALSHYLKAWNHRSKTSLKNRQALLGEIADCYSKMQNFSQAIVFYQKKIELLDSDDPKQRKSQEMMRHNIAKSKIQLDLFEEAIPILREVLLYQQKSLPSPHKSLMEICNQLAFCHERLGLVKEAILFTQQSFSHCPSDHPQGKSLILYNLANRHLLLKNYKEALEFVDASHQAASSLSQNPLLEAPLYLIQGDCYKAQNNIDLALAAYQNAARFYKDLEELSKFNEAMLKIGDCLFYQEKYYRALLIYQQTLVNIETQEPEKTHELIEILKKTGKLHELLGQNAEVAASYRKAWTLIKETKSQKADTITNTLLPLSLCYHRLSDIRRAKIWWHIARLTAEIDFPEDETVKAELWRVKEILNDSFAENF